jgi:hypothetical protein
MSIERPPTHGTPAACGAHRWIKKNEMILTMTEGSDPKARNYEVVSMDPANPDNDGPKSSSPPVDDH